MQSAFDGEYQEIEFDTHGMMQLASIQQRQQQRTSPTAGSSSSSSPGKSQQNDIKNVQTYQMQQNNASFQPQQTSSPRDSHISASSSVSGRLITQTESVSPLVSSKSAAVVTQQRQEEEQIDETINEFSNVFRNEVMDRFFELRSKLAQHYIKQIRRLEREKEILIAEHRNSSDKQQESIAKRDHFLLKFKHLTLNMADAMTKQRERKSDNNFLRLILYKWRQWANAKKQQKKLVRMARKHHRRHLLSSIVNEWRVLTLKSKLANSKLLYESKMQARAAELKNDYSAQMENLALELQKAQELLHAETREKQVLQENLRKALLRGVCAMNNKFLEIINEGRLGAPQQGTAAAGQADDEEQVQSQATNGDGFVPIPSDSIRFFGQTSSLGMTGEERSMMDSTMQPRPAAPLPQGLYPRNYAAPAPAPSSSIPQSQNQFAFRGTAADEIQRSNVKVFRENLANSANKQQHMLQGAQQAAAAQQRHNGTTKYTVVRNKIV